MEGTPPEHFWRTLVADRGSDGKNPPVYYSRACQESFRKGGTTQGVVDTMGLIEHERNSVVAQYCRRVQAAIWNRALVRTQAGRFGLVANNVKEEDLVCILYGCSVPVALRRHGPKKQIVMNCEMKSELRYIVDYVVQSYRTHLARREIFRGKREKDKAEYRKWEFTKRKKWKEDEKWKKQWQLVRAGLVRIHEFSAWVTKKQAIVLKNAEDFKRAEDIMRNYVHILLPRIYEVAAWAAKLGVNNGTIVDRLRSSTSDTSTPESFKLTSDQIQLWDQFASDTDWSEKWNAQNELYVEEEGLRAWSRMREQKKGYAADEQEIMKKWEEVPAEAWIQEWATENSWFICIDPFRAWLREKGKFYGSEEVLDSKQEWEDDKEWHSKRRDKEELDIVSFNAWMEAKGRENPELDISKVDVEIARFEEWRPNWRAEHRDADMLAERKAWDAEWAIHALKDTENPELDISKVDVEIARFEKWRPIWRAENRDADMLAERKAWDAEWAIHALKDTENPELDISKVDVEIARFEEWRPIWRAENRAADMLAERKAWDAAWRKRMTDSEGRRLEEIKNRKERAEKRDKEPFLERWRKGWCPPTVNWQEFEIALRYGKQWLNLVRRCKRDYVNHQGELWATPHAVKKRQQGRASSFAHKYGYRAPAVNRTEVNTQNLVSTNRPASPPRHPKDGMNGNFKPTDDQFPADERVMDRPSEDIQDDTTVAGTERDPQGVDDKWKRSATSESGDNTKAVSANDDLASSTFEASLPRRAASEHSEDHLSGDAPKRAKSYTEQNEESSKGKWHELHQDLLNPLFVSRNELKLKSWIEMKKSLCQVHWEKTMKAVDKQHKEWEHRTPKFLGKDGKFHYDLSRPKSFKEPAELHLNPQQRDERKCRYAKGHYLRSKQRARLTTTAEQVDYMSKVEETFLSRLGDDGRWYYEMLGECYIHGMMDGEAMAHQNDKEIPPAVFEIR
ncbi:hypothetical protein GJ744_004606 [Endocarpon pusillum]|uniref:Uncharacterized protein n=1 Tax=Endocarpon pusillum TaxID=364733 RepID=A0A8H7AR29_9EURO|nr:hypothetical protein GJ744_004606 [Endocarpon pusillum]